MSQAGNINIRKQATISFAGNLVDTGISFLGLVAMAYILGAAGLGQYYLILAIVNVALFPVNGLGQAVLKRGSEEGYDADEIFGTGLTMVLLYGLFITTLVTTTTATGVIPLRFTPKIIFGAAMVFITRAVLNIQIDAYRGYGQTGRATLVDNVYGILETILQLGFLALGYEIFGLLTATTIATVITATGHYLTSIVSASRPQISSARSLITYGRWSILSSGVSTIYQRLPVLVLGIIGLDAAIGYYTSANRLLMLGSYVVGGLSPALMAKTSSRMNRVSHNELYREFLEVHHHVSFLAVAFAFGSFALSDSLMATFFDMTDPLASAALVVLSLYHIIRALSRIEYDFLSALDMPEYSTRTITLGLLVQSTLILILFPIFGFIGVVLVIVVTQLILLAFAQIIYFGKFDNIPLPGGLIPQIASGFLMFIIVEYASRKIAIASIFNLTFLVVVGGVIYTSVLLMIDYRFREAAIDVTHDLANVF